MSAKKFWLAVAVQVLVLFGMIGVHGYTLATGTPVVLKTMPIDPWDPFRGDYVRLGYEITQIRGDQIPLNGAPYKHGQTVWVTLKKGDPYWTATAVSATRPATAAGEVVLKGTVNYFQEAYTPIPAQPVPTDPNGQPLPPKPVKEPAMPQMVNIHYGIEQFYVPEGEGRDLQGKLATMSVEAVVDSFGRAAIHRVFLDGKEIKFQ